MTDTHVFSDRSFTDSLPTEKIRVRGKTSLDSKGLTSQPPRQDLESKRFQKAQVIAEKLASWMRERFPEPMDTDPYRDAMLQRHPVEKTARALRECHTFWTVRRCCDCRDAIRFWNRCDYVLCPNCAARLAHLRLKSLDWLVKEMKEPKHVVITFRNVPALSRRFLRSCLATLQKLRRQPVASSWRGGFWALEVTNKGKGWHVHFHLLVDSPWFSQKLLSETLSYLTSGESYIAYVGDATRDGALSKLPQYIASYSFKGNKIENWTPAQLAEFVLAMHRTRTFAVFGSMYGKRSELVKFLSTLREEKQKCECGSCRFQYFSELEWFMQTEHCLGPPGKLKSAQEPSSFPGYFWKQVNAPGALAN